MRYGVILLCILAAVWAIPVQTLVEQGASYDKTTVTITGEVIGDILYRQNCVWINVLSPEGTAIGIKTTLNAVASIKTTGSDKEHGDMVAVTGTFYRFNKEELGETMVLANKIIILKSGYATPTPISVKKAWLAAILLLIGFGLSLLYTQHYLPRQKPKTSAPSP